MDLFYRFAHVTKQLFQLAITILLIIGPQKGDAVCGFLSFECSIQIATMLGIDS